MVDMVDTDDTTKTLHDGSFFTVVVQFGKFEVWDIWRCKVGWG